MKKIAVLIPCYNEEKGISKVINAIPTAQLHDLGYFVDVIVIDNNSSDKTAKIAKQKAVRVIFEEKKGKGNTIKKGFASLTDDVTYVVMLDGDNTYKGYEIKRLIEPLDSGFCDAVIGSRLGGKTIKDSLKFQNRVANWIYTFLVRQFYRANITDVLSGYFAWKKNVVDSIAPHLESEGFEVEMEMITKMVKMGFEIYSVPITYEKREGDTKLDSLKDGIKILSMFFKNLTWSTQKKERDLLITKLTQEE